MGQNFKEKIAALSKSPLWPAILSGLVVPGLGQIANGELLKGLFLAGASVGSFVYFMKIIINRLTLLLPLSPEQWHQNPVELQNAVQKLITDTPAPFVTFQFLIISVWIYSMVDAYIGAKRKRALPSPSKEDSTDDDANPFRD